MKQALIFKDSKDSGEMRLVTADEVKSEGIWQSEEFVDPEYEIKLQYVSGAKNGGGPYFRLYYSYDEYKERHPDRISKYEILANMRYYDESKWHKDWKRRFEPFCQLEKYIKDNKTGKRKCADAFYEKSKICIEVQHSYIAGEFEERNEFYKQIGLRTIWLYDLTSKASVREQEGNTVDILEDNARGFFRISEKPDNLKNEMVYIQTKNQSIYRVNGLKRRKFKEGSPKSTIRYFDLTEKYTIDGFVEFISNGAGAKPLEELWKPEYKKMFVKWLKNGEIIMVNANGHGGIYREGKYNGTIQYKYGYFDESKRGYRLKTFHPYQMKNNDAQQREFVFLSAENFPEENTNCKKASDMDGQAKIATKQLLKKLSEEYTNNH